MLNLYPTFYVMISSSLVFGLSLGLMVNAQMSCLMTIAIKLTNIYRIVDEEDETKNTRFTCLIRRTARAFKGSNDFGLIIGSLASTTIIFWTVNFANSFSDIFDNTTDITSLNSSAIVDEVNKSELSTTLYNRYSTFLDDIFDTVEGTRLCGSQACPTKYPLNFNDPNNTTPSTQFFSVLPVATTQSLTGFYALLCASATVLVMLGMDALKLYVHHEGSEKPHFATTYRAIREAFRDSRLQLMAPMMFFIGVEQAFIFADFGKSYVVCTLGIFRLNLVYLAMGSLQSIAACTLSMLLRSIRRYYIVGVGFTFHSCLMLVLILWKPMEDDPALFFVISAAWGVCNAIWEMLSFNLLTSQYSTERWEPAFAVTSFYRLLGIAVTFTLHGFLCNYVKLYGLTFFMLAAVITFTFLDVRLENTKKLKNISRL